MEREIDLRMAEHCNRKANAMRYSANARKRMSKATRFVNFLSNVSEYIKYYAEQISVLVLVLATVLMLGYGFVKEPSEPRYAIAGEDNGLHYIYVTERKCEVTEVTDNKVIVSYKGELYSFYGNGYEVGETIVCKFTDNMEIVGVVER